jgi:hypothetical protein
MSSPTTSSLSHPERRRDPDLSALRATAPATTTHEPAARARTADLTRDMAIMAETDETVGAMLYCITTTMRQIAWEFVPQVDGVDAPEDAEAKKWAVFMAQVIGDMNRPFADHVEDALTMLWAGFAPIEIIAKRRSSLVSRYTDGSTASAPSTSLTRPRSGTGLRRRRAGGDEADGRPDPRRRPDPDGEVRCSSAPRRSTTTPAAARC